MIANAAHLCSKLQAKTNPNQNAAVQSTINPCLSNVLSSWYIRVIVCHAVARNKYAISKEVYIQAAQKGKEGIEHLLFGR
jgi:hypothetical protein